MVDAATGPAAQRAPFLTNHDQVRLATQLGNDAGRLRGAAAVLLTLPGTPFLYYGEELGMQNGSGAGDEWKRTPLPWDAAGGFTAGVPWMAFAPGKESANVAAEQADPGSLLARYRALVRVRQGSLALRRGSARAPEGSASPQVLALLREVEGERVLVVHNLSSAAATAGPWALGAGAVERLFADPGMADPEDPGSARVTLPAYSSGIWRLR
jgi:glycosidase